MTPVRHPALDNGRGEEIKAMFEENQIVELREDIVEANVTMPRGSHGTIIDVYSTPFEAYEVEFVAENGIALGQLTLLPGQIRPYSRSATSTN